MFLYKPEQDGAFFADEKILAFDHGDVIFYSPGAVASKIYSNATDKYNFISDQNKVFVRGRVEFFHLMFDTFSIIFQEYKKNPDTLFLINIENENTIEESVWNFFIDILSKKDIKFELVKVRVDRPMRINNFWYFKEYPLLIQSVGNILEVTSEYLTNSIPNKKVFLSRKKFKTNRNDIAYWAKSNIERFSFKDDNRMDNEDLLSDYMISLGFEVVYPEDFNNMKEQIAFFSEVKTLASVTSAGIVNSIFMPKNGKVIEFTVPLIVGGTESLHDVYHGISFAKYHKYTSIGSMRKAQDIIDIIESDTKLKEYICE